jgi:hypothetical protein
MTSTDTTSVAGTRCSLADYAAHRAAGGARVLRGSGETIWVEHESGAMTRIPPFHAEPPAPGEVPRVLWSSRRAVATFLLSPTPERPANAWLYASSDRGYALDRLASAMRRNVRRGLRELTIAPVAPADLLAHGVAAFCDTRRRVGLSDGTPEDFDRRFRGWVTRPGHTILGAWKGDTLAAFLSLVEVDDWTEIEGCFSANALLSLRPNDTLMYSALSGHLTEDGRRIVCYGLSSIQAESNAATLHTFKTKVGFEARPVHRAFAVHPLLAPLANRLTGVALRALLRVFPRERRLKKAEGMMATLLGAARQPNGAPEDEP